MILVTKSMSFSHWCVLHCAGLSVVVYMCANTSQVMVNMGDVFRGQFYDSGVLIPVLRDRLFSVQENAASYFFSFPSLWSLAGKAYRMNI